MASKDTIANLGLVGYILLLVSSLLGFFVFGIIIGFIGWLIVGIAWFLLGGWARAPSFKIIGLILILAPIAAVVAGIIGVISVISSEITTANVSSPPSSLDVSPFINGLIFVIVIALEIYLVGEFFHIVAHYKAYKVLNISTFKYAMLTWGAAFIARVIALILIIQTIASILPVILTRDIGAIAEEISNNTTINVTSNVLPQELTTQILGALGSAMLAGIIGFILGIIASIISMLAFNGIKSIVLEEEQRPFTGI